MTHHILKDHFKVTVQAPSPGTLGPGDAPLEKRGRGSVVKEVWKPILDSARGSHAHGSHMTPFWDLSSDAKSGSPACWEWAEGQRT